MENTVGLIDNVTGACVWVETVGENENLTGVPSWKCPPKDAWALYPERLVILFLFYIVCYFIGQFVNWICLLNLRKTKMTDCAKYMMLLQCFFNTTYITINFPYKAALLFRQATFIPWTLKVICGWVYLFCVFGSMFLQDSMAVTRVIYIVFPQKAKDWLNTKAKSFVPTLFPIVMGVLYAMPSIHTCCYRFYKFSSYAMSYVGPEAQTQLRFSVTGSSVLIFTLFTCYSSVFIVVRRSSKAMHNDKKGQRRQKKEVRLTILFAITGGIWLVYLILFYSIYWSGLFKAYSWLLIINEMIEQLLFFVDPIVYMGMSSELRAPIMKFLGITRKVGPSSDVTTTTTKGDIAPPDDDDDDDDEDSRVN